MNSTAIDIEPVVKELRVPLSVADAFILFTQNMGRWWPLRSHSCAQEPGARIEFPDRTGGDIIERTETGASHVWGTLLVWDPPHRFAMSWHPGNASAQATHVDVRFTVVRGGCLLRLVHSGWAARGEDGAQAREQYDQGWITVLACFTTLATAPR